MATFKLAVTNATEYINALDNITKLERLDNDLARLYKHYEKETYNYAEEFSRFEREKVLYIPVAVPLTITTDDVDEFKIYALAPQIDDAYVKITDIISRDFAAEKELFGMDATEYYCELAFTFDIEIEDMIAKFQNSYTPSVQDFAYLYSQVMWKIFEKYGISDLLFK